jgi:N-acyl-D-amino-acid deacylase
LYPERNFSDRKETEFILREVARAEDLFIGTYSAAPEYAGKTVAQIAQMRGSDAATTLEWLIAEAIAKDANESVVATGMDERDVVKIMQWPHTSISSDGALNAAHPRGFGSFTRVLGRYVREQKALAMQTAIHKMTALPAQNLGFDKERGRIAVGTFADLVLFDPNTVADRATISTPHLISDGVRKVWVNGQVVFADGKTTGKYPGKVNRRPT